MTTRRTFLLEAPLGLAATLAACSGSGVQPTAGTTTTGTTTTGTTQTTTTTTATTTTT